MSQHDVDQQIIVLMRMFLYLKLDEPWSSQKKDKLLDYIHQRIMDLTGSN